jgi:hypothetical protein
MSSAAVYISQVLEMTTTHYSKQTPPPLQPRAFYGDIFENIFSKS